MLEHHIDPPARQQMILSGIKALYQAAGVPVPTGLGRRVSEVTTTEQLAAMLADSWPKSTARPAAAKSLEETLFDGLLTVVPGGAELISAKERKVAERFEGNRYVGIHIALSMDDKEKLPTIATAFERGPADRAGAKRGDLIEEIDGVATKGMKLHDVVDLLRGEDGTHVTIKVRQPNDTKSRTYKLTRGQLPHATIEGFRKLPDGNWDSRIDGPEPIGYLKFTEIGASTPHELRKIAQQLESEGVQALVLDLRLGGRSAHPAVLLADCLLDHGPIGRVRTVRGETTYQADSDALFRGWPIAVLVDQNTSGTAEWLAAALQDNHRATIIGTPTAGAVVFGEPSMGGIRSRVSIGDGSWSIELLTGYLERGDGRPLSRRFENAIDARLRGSFVRRGGLEQPPEIKTGVKPDLLTGPNPVLPRVSPPERILRPAPQPVTKADDPLVKALEWLTKSMKKS